MCPSLLIGGSEAVARPETSGDEAFANWVLAASNFGVPMTSISQEDYTDIERST
ncbi:MAG: hypothetical protein ACTHWA_02920 [Arachnia sp.]